MLRKKNVIVLLTLSILSASTLAENGSVSNICSQRNGKMYKSVVIQSLNTGDDIDGGSSSNILISNTWSHIDHSLSNLQSFLRAAYFTGTSIDVCLSSENNRVLVAQGN